MVRDVDPGLEIGSIDNESLYLDDGEEATREYAGADNAFQRKETDMVLRWRLAVALMLLITATTVIASTYKFLTRAEDKEFLATVCIHRVHLVLEVAGQ
jgi:hypothetical protein